MADALSRSVNNIEIVPDTNFADEKKNDMDIQSVITCSRNKSNFSDLTKNSYASQFTNTKKLCIENGILCYKGLGGCKPVLPNILIQPILTLVHTKILNHMGMNKCTDMLRNHCYWANVEKYISDYIKGCITCSKTKSKNYTPKA